MKKTLALTALILSLATAKAEAHPWMCAPVVAGSTGGTIIFTGGMAAFAMLPVAIVELQDVHVWNYIAPVVEETFPGDKLHPQAVRLSYTTPKHLAYVNGKEALVCDGAGCM